MIKKKTMKGSMKLFFKNPGKIKINYSTIIREFDEQIVLNTRPYSEIPGPKAIPFLPFLGNTWRFIPYIGDS